MKDLAVVDFETFYSKDYQLRKMTTERYINDPRFEVIGVSVRTPDQPANWFSGTMAETAEFLYSYQWANYHLLAHHAAFDGAILGWKFNIHPKFLLDTMSMAKPTVGAVVGSSLAALSEHFGIGKKGHEALDAKGKRRADFSRAELRQYGEYCKNDVNLTYDLFFKLMPLITPQELYIIDMLLRMYTDPVLELDRPLLEAHLADVLQRKNDLLEKIDSSVGLKALMSNPQLATILEGYGVEPPTKLSKPRKDGSIVPIYAFAKTDPGMKELLEHPNPDVQAIVAARLGVKSTIEETRTQRFLEIEPTGVMPIPLGYYNAHTGRAGGWDKINMQNMTRGGNLRRSVRAKKGHKLVSGDSAQIEARVVAWWAGETDLVAAFANGEDIYSLFASDIYGMPVNRKKKVMVDGVATYPHFGMGFVGKTAILGLGFQMGAARFKAQLKTFGHEIELDEAKRVVYLYRNKYKMIERLWAEAERALLAMSQGMEYELGVDIKLKCDSQGVHLPNGMIQQYPDLRREVDSKTGKASWVYRGRYEKQYIYGGKLVENIVQALARIIVFNQMCIVKKNLDKFDMHLLDMRYRIVMTVHDEIVCVAPDHHAMEVAALLNRVMRRVPRWAEGLPVSCEIDMGDNYADAKVVEFN